jgi:exopolysaccharide biosynthesis polyprenyl glycosylphosphotransferase
MYNWRGRERIVLRYYRRQFNFVCVFADLGALLSAFFLAYLGRKELVPLLIDSLAKRPVFGLDYYLPILVLTSFVILGTLYWSGAYREYPGLPLSLAFLRGARSVGVAFLLTLALAYLLKLTWMSRLFLVFFMLLFLVISTALKHAVALWFRAGAQRGRYSRVVVLVGAGAQARGVVKKLLERPELGIRIHGFMTVQPADTPDNVQAMKGFGVPHLGDVSQLTEVIRGEVVDAVIFSVAVGDLAIMEELFLACEDLGLDTLLAANLFPHLIAQAQLEKLEELPLLRFTTIPHDQEALFFKRLFDLISSALGLLVLSPLLGLTALLVKTTSEGPVFFRQERMGLNGRRFTCLKFRTMVANAEALKAQLERFNEVDGPVFKIRNDPRITPLGRLLRKTSLDELPQLLNVFKGDMSLVGPRPPIPSEVEKYERWQRRRLSMRPGITCLWQISGRSQLDFDTWMKLDLQYIDNWSLTLDFIILLKTVPAVLSARGAA